MGHFDEEACSHVGPRIQVQGDQVKLHSGLVACNDSLEECAEMMKDLEDENLLLRKELQRVTSQGDEASERISELEQENEELRSLEKEKNDGEEEWKKKAVQRTVLQRHSTMMGATLADCNSDTPDIHHCTSMEGLLVRETIMDPELMSQSSTRTTLNPCPPGARQFQKKVEQVKTLLRTLEQKDKASETLRMQRDDFAASLRNQQNLAVKLENGLLQRDTELKQKQSLLDELQAHCDELRGMLDSERDVADQLRMKVQRLEDKLECERRRVSCLTEIPVHSAKSEAGDNLADALRTAGGLCPNAECEECECLREQLADMKNQMLQECAELRSRLRNAEAILAKQELETRLPRAHVCKREACDTTRELLRLCLSAAPGTFRPDEQRQLQLLRRQLLEKGNKISGSDGREEPRERIRGVCPLSEPEEELAPPPSVKADPDHQRLLELQDQLGDVVPNRVSSMIWEEDSISVRPTEARKELASTVEELNQECSRLSLQLAKVSENEEQQLRHERNQLLYQLASSRRLEEEQERTAEQLRSTVTYLQRLLAASGVGHEAIEGVLQDHEMMLAGSWAETENRTKDLQHENRRLREQIAGLRAMQDASSSGSGAEAASQAQELSSLREKCTELGDRLHTSRLHELEARRNADAVPELQTWICQLQTKLADSERANAEMRDTFGGPSWSSIFNGFMCATPNRPVVHTHVADAGSGAAPVTWPTR